MFRQTMDPLIQMDPPLFSVSSFLSGRDLRPEAFRDGEDLKLSGLPNISVFGGFGMSRGSDMNESSTSQI